MTATALTRFEERARLQAIEAACDTLPVTARSLTADEVCANNARVMMMRDAGRHATAHAPLADWR